MGDKGALHRAAFRAAGEAYMGTISGMELKAITLEADAEGALIPKVQWDPPEGDIELEQISVLLEVAGKAAESIGTDTGAQQTIPQDQPPPGGSGVVAEYKQRERYYKAVSETSEALMNPRARAKLIRLGNLIMNAMVRRCDVPREQVLRVIE